MLFLQLFLATSFSSYEHKYFLLERRLILKNKIDCTHRGSRSFFLSTSSYFFFFYCLTIMRCTFGSSKGGAPSFFFFYNEDKCSIYSVFTNWLNPRIIIFLSFFDVYPMSTDKKDRQQYLLSLCRYTEWNVCLEEHVFTKRFY